MVSDVEKTLNNQLHSSIAESIKHNSINSVCVRHNHTQTHTHGCPFIIQLHSIYWVNVEWILAGLSDATAHQCTDSFQYTRSDMHATMAAL